MTPRIVLLPGDGIGPEIMEAAKQLLAAVGDFETDEQLVGGASIDAHGSSAHRRGARRLPRRRRGAARRGRRPEVGQHRPGRAAARAGPAGPAQGARPVREHPARPPEPGAARRQPAEARAHRGHRPDRRARAHRRDLLRRPRPGRRHRPRHLRLQRRRDRAHRARGIPDGAAQGHERRQGEHPRDLAPLAQDRSAPRGGGAAAARAHAGGQRRDAARVAPGGVRRDPHGEHVRGHPQRRGGDAHGLARHASERLGRRRGAGPVRARARLGARYRGQRDRKSARNVRFSGHDAPRYRYGRRRCCRRIRRWTSRSGRASGLRTWAGTHRQRPPPGRFSRTYRSTRT